MILRVLILMLCCAFAVPYVWAFGPQGDGKIQNSRDAGQSQDSGEFPYFAVYQDTTIPFSYPSLTRRDVSRSEKTIDVEGRSTAKNYDAPLILSESNVQGLSIDLGDRGVQAAIEDAKRRYGVRALYDVRIDKKLFSVCFLGVCPYSKVTTIVHGKGVLKRDAQIPKP